MDTGKRVGTDGESEGRSLVPYAVALACILAITGACSKVLDTPSVERQIEQQLERQLSGVTVSVDCPEDIAAARGEEFDCTATTDADQRATIAVVQTDDDGTIDFEVKELVEDE